MARKPMLVAVPLAVALFGAAGCSFSVGSNDLDVRKAETEIAKGIQEQTGTAATVKCPESVQIQPGASFTCEAVLADGEAGTVTVTQTDDQGNVTWNLEPLPSPAPTFS